MAKRLFVFTVPGCNSCRRVKGALLGFERKHPEVKIERIDLTDVPQLPFPIALPTAAPAFLLLESGKPPRTVVKALNGKGIEAWVFAHG
jgi:hypothetical protein